MPGIVTLIRTCGNGHRYEKRSDCPVCPICEAVKKPVNDLPVELSAPARRALAAAGIISLQQLTAWSPGVLLQLHGIGPASLPILQAALIKSGRDFKIVKDDNGTSF